MLDVVLRGVAFGYDHGFALRDIEVVFPRSVHTALAGPPGCGATTLLRLIAGTLRPAAGGVVFGQRRVNELKAAQRPSLLVTSALEVPGRWSVEHALVAAVRTRTLDRTDRHMELQLAAGKWTLDAILERRIDSLSSTETVRVHCARIELTRPAILLADRALAGVNASARAAIADELYRTLRVMGTTVISAPSSRDELAFSENVVVLDGGRIVQKGTASQLFSQPASDAAAMAIGEADVIPITIRGTLVESVIGSWEVSAPPFQGSGVAIVRPSDFSPAGPGEDSDLIFGVEEAGFTNGRWIARGMISGGLTLRVELPRDAPVHKGRLLALRYNASHFRLLPRDNRPLPPAIPTDVVPPLRETR